MTAPVTKGIPRSVDAEEYDATADDLNDEHAHHSTDHRARAAGKRGSADNDSGDDNEREVRALIWIDRPPKSNVHRP